MAKFFIGVIVGISLGASASAYGAVAAGSGTVPTWTGAKDGEPIINSDRPASAARTSKPWRPLSD